MANDYGLGNYRGERGKKQKGGFALSVDAGASLEISELFPTDGLIAPI